MKNKMTTRERVATNIISHYGREQFLFLINAFSSGTPGPAIAREMGVTRQRVNQWKKKLGVEHITFVLYPEVERMTIENSAALSRTTI